ncbi:cytochrome P450 monooxygenase [Saccharata proteae CBS 121410]|uniref:Cytochrome P450 monooxygenase n=1 Tax=Saccharata proteae CBS 121410 TaxID=1314787 RepID=A0A9P4HKM2_9PEZI|nr:cytochrome P450 monooxygenase [Saccharata proteae CBS 121410]
MFAVSAPYAALLGVCFFSYFIVYPVFEYFRDPKGLRKFPNMSTFSGMSNIPFMLLAHGGFRSKHLAELHKKHPVIRTGPNSLSYGDVRAIKDIYGHNTKCTKDDSYVVTAGTHYHLADVVSKPDHARKRKVLSSAYAIKNLEGWEYKVADKTARMLAHFDKVCTAPLPAGVTTPAKEDLTLDYRAWTNFFTLDAIADIGLSERLGFLDQGHDRVRGRRPDGSTYECNFRECLYQKARKQSLLVWPYAWYPFLDKASNLLPFYGRMGKLGRDWDGIAPALAHRRLARYQAGENLDDFFQALMRDKNGVANELEWGEVVAEVSIMLNAGSATTAIAMANVLYQLLKHPHCMQRLRQELDAAIDSADLVASYDTVKHLPYLRACLDESLRLFPPTAHALPRQTPPEGASILDDYIPAGTSVGMSALVAHRDEAVYPDAERFVPERWLGDAGRKLQPFFIAFSAGARGCIGRNISYLEQSVVLASVVRRYAFCLPAPGWELPRLETMNLLLGDMPVKVWRREGSS